MLLLVNNSLKRVFKRRLKVSLPNTTLWKACKVLDWRPNLSLRRGSSVLIGGAFERLSCPERKGIWTSQSPIVQMPGGVPGGDVELSNWSAHYCGGHRLHTAQMNLGFLRVISYNWYPVDVIFNFVRSSSVIQKVPQSPSANAAQIFRCRKFTDFIWKV